MWPLLGCSVIALTVIIERCFFWYSMKMKKDIKDASEVLKEIGRGAHLPMEPGGVITAMLCSGLSVNFDNCSKAMEVTALEAIARMRRGMGILDTIITASPMLGILGTVLGIIASFDMLGQAGVGDPKAVIGGIAQALITTVFGLGIAVITIFPYNYFNCRIDSMEELLEVYGSQLELLRSQDNGAED